MSRTTRSTEDLPLTNESTTLNAEDSVKLLAETFYPKDDREEDTIEHRKIRDSAEMTENDAGGHCDPLFRLFELHRAVRSFDFKRAPGSDGLTTDICAQAVGSAPELFLALINKCLELSGTWIFPSCVDKGHGHKFKKTQQNYL